MSTLNDFCKGHVDNPPNKVHNIPQAEPEPNHETLTKQASNNRNALANGTVFPALFYSEEEQVPVHGQIEESPHGVESKLQDREEFPYG